MQVHLELKPTRPQTSLEKKNLKKRPVSTVRPKTGRPIYNAEVVILETNTNANMTYLNTQSQNKDKVNDFKKLRSVASAATTHNSNDYRIRPLSSLKDRVFNKYWQDDGIPFKATGNFQNTTNLASSNAFTSNVVTNLNTNANANANTNENIKYKSPKLSGITNSMITDNMRDGDNFRDRDILRPELYQRQLYKYNKIDWDSKKMFNFLTSVGGVDITPGQIMNIDNISLNTTNTTLRPVSSLSNKEYFYAQEKKRPLTSMNHPMREIDSAREVVQRVRPITAINSNKNKFRPASSSQINKM